MISNDLLNILACPACKGSLQADVDKRTVSCHQCSLAFAVTDGIPIMLLDVAQKFSDQDMAENLP
jgi:uncharacterized protein YbaR (Trm112 family)